MSRFSERCRCGRLKETRDSNACRHCYERSRDYYDGRNGDTPRQPDGYEPSDPDRDAYRGT